jgi:class 3 adenylate cyclase
MKTTDRPGASILVVDDTAANRRLLSKLLCLEGYVVQEAAGGHEALALAQGPGTPDLILLDVLMPDLDGFSVCRRLRAMPALQATPIVMITSLDALDERVKGLDSGADDFLSKPVVPAELFARVRSLLRVKALFDEVSRQRRELAEWSATLETRVQEKVAEIARLDRLKRFFSPRLAMRLVAEGRDPALTSRRTEVSVLFIDLRGFTAFAETQPAGVVMELLGQFHAAMGELITQFDGTLERFTGDGMMVFFNDPDPVPDHARRAVGLGLSMATTAERMAAEWRQRGGPTGAAIGIAKGLATVGPIGFEHRLDYAAIGTVTNLAARLCAEARAGEVMLSEDVWADVQDLCPSATSSSLALKGFSALVTGFRVSLEPSGPPSPARR